MFKFIRIVEYKFDQHGQEKFIAEIFTKFFSLRINCKAQNVSFFIRRKLQIEEKNSDKIYEYIYDRR